MPTTDERTIAEQMRTLEERLERVEQVLLSLQTDNAAWTADLRQRSDLQELLRMAQQARQQRRAL